VSATAEPDVAHAAQIAREEILDMYATPCETAEKGLSSLSGPDLGVTINMNERRVSQRIPMGLPIEIRWKTRAGTLKQAVGKTGNISGNGLLIEIPIRLPRSTSLMMNVLLPRGKTQAPLELSCQGRVVRLKGNGQVDGLCVVIDEYELRPVSLAGSGGKRPRKQLVRIPGRTGIKNKRPST